MFTIGKPQYHAAVVLLAELFNADDLGIGLLKEETKEQDEEDFFAAAPAPCVARTSVGLRLTQASLHAVVAGARRRIDPCCPRVQVARGGQMQPLKGSWRALPAQLAAAARPQARPQLWVPWARLGRLVGPCSDRCAGLCAYSPCGVCVRLMSRSSSLVVYLACRCVQTHDK